METTTRTVVDAKLYPTLAKLFEVHRISADHGCSKMYYLCTSAELLEREQGLSKQLAGEFPGFPTELDNIDPYDVMED